MVLPGNTYGHFQKPGNANADRIKTAPITTISSPEGH